MNQAKSDPIWTLLARNDQNAISTLVARPPRTQRESLVRRKRLSAISSKPKAIVKPAHVRNTIDSHAVKAGRQRLHAHTGQPLVNPAANASARILAYNEDDLRATLAVVDWPEGATRVDAG